MKDRRTIQGLLLFGALFALFCSLMEYGRVLHLRPLPHHLWRQTVSLSITRNYYDQQLDFLDTQVSNLYLDKGWSGKAAGEFPLLYYGVAKLWNWTGRSEAAYRVVMLVLHALAALALFDLSRRILGKNGLAAMVALLFLASPALVYFALAFMTEVPALDLLLIGAWALALHRSSNDRSALVVAMFLFTLAGLLKVTALMLPLTLLAILVVEAVGRHRLGVHGPLFTRRPVAAGLMLLACCAVVWWWYDYSTEYNHLHFGSFSNQAVMPPWEMAPEAVVQAWGFAKTLLPGMLMHVSMQVLMVAAAVHVLFRYRRLPIGVRAANVVLLLGTAAYTLLFFPALNNHDYYFIIPLLAPWTLLLSSCWILQQQYPRTMAGAPLLIGMGLLTLINMEYAREDHLMRTRGEGPVAGQVWTPLHTPAQVDQWERCRYWGMAGLLDIEPVARSLGVLPSDTVICITDNSVCAALYLAGQRGWQNFGNLRDLQDADALEFYRARGARYLYLIDAKGSWRDYMEPFTRRPIGEHHGVVIHDLRQDR